MLTKWNDDDNKMYRDLSISLNPIGKAAVSEEEDKYPYEQVLLLPLYLWLYYFFGKL
jgi:hypothetical protein